MREFHDNIPDAGGGDAGSAAIRGRILVDSLTIDANGLVTGFTIRATITNDLPIGSSGPFSDGTNSHGQAAGPRFSAPNVLRDVLFSAEFADDGRQGNFPAFGSPYFGPESNIYARNYDWLAWYSFSDTGAFQVPTWGFDSVRLGETVSRDLLFGFYAPVAQSTIQSLIDAEDIFMNRTTDLKIGDYFEQGSGGYEGLVLDDGSAFPTSASRSGNVSVFVEVPEPGTVGLILVGLAAGLVGRRQRSCRVGPNHSALRTAAE